jgi:hypothetical protein
MKQLLLVGALAAAASFAEQRSTPRSERRG